MDPTQENQINDTHPKRPDLSYEKHSRSELTKQRQVQRKDAKTSCMALGRKHLCFDLHQAFKFNGETLKRLDSFSGKRTHAWSSHQIYHQAFWQLAKARKVLSHSLGFRQPPTRADVRSSGKLRDGCWNGTGRDTRSIYLSERQAFRQQGATHNPSTMRHRSILSHIPSQLNLQLPSQIITKHKYHSKKFALLTMVIYKPSQGSTTVP